MCRFFSFCSINGKPLYFNAEQRRKIFNNEGEFKDRYCLPDSHTSIASFYGYKGEREDLLNKYEYNPFAEEFTIDTIGKIDDSKEMEKWVRKLNFKAIGLRL